MTTDIVERLRLDADTLWPPPIALLREAADEIERLRAIIRKQMEPTEISQRLAECNELADAHAEQKAEIERLRKELRYLVHTDEDIKVQNAEIKRLRTLLAQAGHPDMTPAGGE